MNKYLNTQDYYTTYFFCSTICTYVKYSSVCIYFIHLYAYSISCQLCVNLTFNCIIHDE